MHESQSLLWEKFIAQSEPFWSHYWPLILEIFPNVPKTKSAHDAFIGCNKGSSANVIL